MNCYIKQVSLNLQTNICSVIINLCALVKLGVSEAKLKTAGRQLRGQVLSILSERKREADGILLGHL